MIIYNSLQILFLCLCMCVCVGVTFDLLSQFCVLVACYITLLNTRADKFAPVIAYNSCMEVYEYICCVYVCDRNKFMT